METMNVTFDELSAMAFEQSSSKPASKHGALDQISSDRSYLCSVNNNKLNKLKLKVNWDLLYRSICMMIILVVTVICSKNCSSAQSTSVLQTPRQLQQHQNTSRTPKIHPLKLTNGPKFLHGCDDARKTQQHGQHQPATIADNVPNAMFDENTFVNPFATPSTSDAEPSSSQYVDPSNMHTFYQPYPHEYSMAMDHPLGNK
ncbi:hypothetical protein Tco_0558235 [Tanacetum coccineum]